MKVNRWGIALAGIVLQVVLGSVYAWSVFRTPLTRQFHWTISQVTLTFTICIVVLGFAAFFGGLWLAKAGPRTVAVTGALLYGLGTFLASFSGNSLWILYATYGLIGGIGLGFAYIVPVAVLVKWFPDRRGFITGVAVGGFGTGALITAPVATHLMASFGVLRTFALLGVAYAVLGVVASLFMRNPDKDWKPEGWVPSAALKAQRNSVDHTLGEALKTWQWWALWAILFLNTSAGISLISQESPVFQELAKVSVIVAAGMVGIVSIGNAVGRVFWAWVSDLLSRRTTFLVTFLLQVILFWFLPGVAGATTLTAVTFLILMCYGGGFGTMPAFAADYFGSSNVGSIYGLMLTAWGAASAFGPLLVAHMRQTSGNYRSGFHTLALIVLVATIIPLAIRPPAASSS
ncbi:L-lactate MFS transporter [Granulicella sibirica]|uniref:Oxalate/formate antiporter n=1 Tax=Granulicella sibirica TaxID=2479048 RepID=A0A4Q0STB1_9BACT|nr:OFA family MFS transporter [Granulicella sibirica]RXH54165.1 oxalate/formate antiporter [Granulicella sibirica]